MAIDPTARVADGARIGRAAWRSGRIASSVRKSSSKTACASSPTSTSPASRRSARARSSIRSRRSARRRNRCIIAAARRDSSSAPRCELREGVTMNTGTEDGGGMTRVGDRCLFMVASPRRARLRYRQRRYLRQQRGARRSCQRRRHTFLGGNAAVHQFARIGEGAMVGGSQRHVRRPHSVRLCAGQIATLDRAQRRRPAAPRCDPRRVAPAAPRLSPLFFGAGVFADRIDDVAEEFADDPMVAKGRRVHPRRRQAAVDASRASSDAAEDNEGDAS